MGAAELVRRNAAGARWRRRPSTWRRVASRRSARSLARRLPTTACASAALSGGGGAVPGSAERGARSAAGSPLVAPRPADRRLRFRLSAAVLVMPQPSSPGRFDHQLRLGGVDVVPAPSRDEVSRIGQEPAQLVLGGLRRPLERHGPSGRGTRSSCPQRGYSSSAGAGTGSVEYRYGAAWMRQCPPS
jgi:hypothetical protein